MGRFIGGRFGSIVPIAPGTDAPSAVYTINDQYYSKQDGGWRATGLTASGGIVGDYAEGPAIYRAHVFTASGTFEVTDLGSFGNTIESVSYTHLTLPTKA